MSGDDEIQNTAASSSQQPFLPPGLSMPKALIIEGNLEIINRFEDEFKTATFLSCIGEDAFEIFESLHYPSKDDGKKLGVVITKFQDLF